MSVVSAMLVGMPAEYPMLFRDPSCREEDIETNLAVEVVQSGQELSLRAIARQRRVDAATLVRRWGSREAMMDAVLLTMECRWIQHVIPRWEIARADASVGALAGLVGLLPDVEGKEVGRQGQTVEELGVMSAFRDLTRNRSRSRDIVLEIREEERRLVEQSLGDLLGRPVAAVETDVVCAVLEGLRRRIVDRHDPMTPSAAADALGWAVSCLVERPTAA